jgi:ubiquinone/menaquinone biosynthesis C-methylase UbiE
MSAINTSPRLASRLVNGILAIAPLANFAKHKARQMMIDRAEGMGVPWRKIVAEWRSRDLEAELPLVENPDTKYPDYYLTSFHAYDKGNMSWEAATEVEVAAYAVHSKIWQDSGADGDAMLRRSYHDVISNEIKSAPEDILDLGCSVGMSTFALQNVYPQAQITGLDLSPYFLAIANCNLRDRQSTEHKNKIKWVHAAAESTGLPDASFDLVSIFLVCHELPQTATREILREARRVLRPGGHIVIMDMNPRSQIYAKMPPYILTLLKSTEPYLDQYFALDIEEAIADAGFTRPSITENTVRHRTMVAQVIA